MSNGFESTITPPQIAMIIGIVCSLLLGIWQSIKSNHFQCNSCCGLCSLVNDLENQNKEDNKQTIIHVHSNDGGSDMEAVPRKLSNPIQS
jgi:hypothetical protein